MIGAYGFGLVAMMYAFARMIGDLVDFQSWQIVLNYGARHLNMEERQKFGRVIAFSFMLDLLSGVMGSLCGMAIALSAAGLLGWPPAIRSIGVIYCLSIFFMSTATATGILRLFNRFDLLARQGVVATVIRVLGILMLYPSGASLPLIMAVWMLAEGGAWSTLIFYAGRELLRRNLLPEIALALKQMPLSGRSAMVSCENPGIWSLAISSNINSSLALTFGHVGTLIVGTCLGPSDAGYYRIASQIAAGIAKPVTLTQTTLYPEITRLWQERAGKRLIRLCAQVALTGGIAGTVLLLLALLGGTPIMSLVIGEHPHRATSLMLWLLAAEIATVWSLPLEPLLFTTQRASSAASARLGTLFIYIPTLIGMMRWRGLNGVGIATFAGTTLLIAIQLALVLNTRYSHAPRSSGSHI